MGAASHTVLSQKAERWMTGLRARPPAIFIQSRFPANGLVLPYSGRVFPTDLVLSRNAQRGALVVILNLSKLTLRINRQGGLIWKPGFAGKCSGSGQGWNPYQRKMMQCAASQADSGEGRRASEAV